VADLVMRKPPGVDLVLTGRHADASIIKMADVVTEMTSVKHAFERGIEARAGIDY
jgi:cob(I)alamin adenosyltransferase